MKLYDVYKNRKISLKNNGYDYRGRILLRTTSNVLWGNPMLTEFGTYLEKILNHWIYCVKAIKKAKNPFVHKDDDNTN
jgi:hypothetical protein